MSYELSKKRFCQVFGMGSTQVLIEIFNIYFNRACLGLNKPGIMLEFKLLCLDKMLRRAQKVEKNKKIKSKI